MARQKPVFASMKPGSGLHPFQSPRSLPLRLVAFGKSFTTKTKRGEEVERLVTVKAMRERYGCSLPTARKYLRQCVPHMEEPLVAPEWAVKEWEERRTVYPAEISRKAAFELRQRQKSGRVIVPRKR